MRDRENYNAYQRTYQKDRYRLRKQVAITFLGGHCVRCNRTEDLEFDHIDPATKSFNVTDLRSVSEKKFWAEIAKCQLLCHECHQLKTFMEQSVPHGGGKAGRRNCKCSPCKTRRSEYMNARRKTKSGKQT